MQKKNMEVRIYATIGGEFLCGVEDAGVCCKDYAMQGGYE